MRIVNEEASEFADKQGGFKNLQNRSRRRLRFLETTLADKRRLKLSLRVAVSKLEKFDHIVVATDVRRGVEEARVNGGDRLVGLIEQGVAAQRLNPVADGDDDVEIVKLDFPRHRTFPFLLNCSGVGQTTGLTLEFGHCSRASILKGWDHLAQGCARRATLGA